MQFNLCFKAWFGLPILPLKHYFTINILKKLIACILTKSLNLLTDINNVVLIQQKYFAIAI